MKFRVNAGCKFSIIISKNFVGRNVIYVPLKDDCVGGSVEVRTGC